jgi:general secretion pathway protein C
MNRILTFNIILAVLCLIILAKLSSDIISYRLSHLMPPTTRTTSAPSTIMGTEDLASFGPILEKGLFGKATEGKLTAIVQNTAGKTGASTSQKDLLLLGTAVGSPRETFALIQKISAKDERVFRLGDEVFDIGQLVAVQKEMVEIQSGGTRIKILTPTATTAETEKPAVPPPAATLPGALATEVGAGTYIIDQRALNAALNNIGQAMTDARLLPSIKDGKVEGFKVSEVKPAGIFGMVGVKNGDILLRMNDFPIDSPEKAIQSLVSLKGQNKIRLDLIRDGQPTTLNYEIR